MVALSRVFVHHEAKSIIRWGVQETLNMPLEGSPLLEKEHWQVFLLFETQQTPWKDTLRQETDVLYND